MRRQAGRIIIDRLMTPPVGASNWLYLSLVVMALDQLSKYYIVENLELFDRAQLFFWLDIVRLHNTGAAFSFLSDATGWQRWLFIVLGIGVSVAIVLWLRRVPRRGHTWLAISLALIVGGALGNVIDRAIYGYVVDFVSVHYAGWYFPAFNVADSAISVGAAMLVIDSLFLERKRLPVTRDQGPGSGESVSATPDTQDSGLEAQDSKKRKGTVTGDQGPGTSKAAPVAPDAQVSRLETQDSNKRKVRKKSASKKKTTSRKKKKKGGKTSNE